MIKKLASQNPVTLKCLDINMIGSKVRVFTLAKSIKNFTLLYLIGCIIGIGGILGVSAAMARTLKKEPEKTSESPLQIVPWVDPKQRPIRLQSLVFSAIFFSKEKLAMRILTQTVLEVFRKHCRQLFA